MSLTFITGHILAVSLCCPLQACGRLVDVVRCCGTDFGAQPHQLRTGQKRKSANINERFQHNTKVPQSPFKLVFKFLQNDSMSCCRATLLRKNKSKSWAEVHDSVTTKVKKTLNCAHLIAVWYFLPFFVLLKKNKKTKKTSLSKTV